MNTIEIEVAFREAAGARGLMLPNRLVADGVLHRCGTVDKPHQMDGAYLLHLDGIAAGGFENHRDGLDWQNWCSLAENEMSDTERTEHRRRVVAAKKLRDEELTEKRARAKREAQHIWNRSAAATSHPYLAKKGIKPNGARIDGGSLVISIQDITGEIHSLQTIDADGGKLFLSGGRKQGCFFPIGKFDNVTAVFIAEGFATGASVHEATGAAVAVAFDCGNLKLVAEALRKRWPRAKITVCADDDWKTPGNPGLEKASEAARTIGGMTAAPMFGSNRHDRQDGQTDWNDLHQAAGIETVKRQLAPFLGPSFASLPSRLVDEAKERVEEGRHILRFGVKFLDDLLGGIMRTDLILIGAPTGVGKTGLATGIAKANCYAGKRVHYFALEAEDKEIERRMKYQIISRLYYAQYGGNRPICYLDWRMGKIEDEVSKFNDQADEELSRLCRTLHTYYKEDSFTSDDFASHFAAIQGDTDLAVLDLFSEVDSDDENENRAAKKIITMIRSAALHAKKPVVIVGHVRKSDPRFAPLVPREEDFHGSKALINAITKAIMLAPDYDTDTNDPMLWSTFIKAVKCRPESARTRYCAKIQFDVRNDSYREEYILGRLVDGGKKWEALNQDQVPAWSANPRELPVDSIPVEDE